MVLSGQIRKSAPEFASLSAEESMSSFTPPVAAVDVFRVLRKRVRMHRDLGMGARTEKPRAFHADRPITKSCAFGRAGDNADVVGHAPIITNRGVDQSSLLCACIRFDGAHRKYESTPDELKRVWKIDINPDQTGLRSSDSRN